MRRSLKSKEAGSIPAQATINPTERKRHVVDQKPTTNLFVSQKSSKLNHNGVCEMNIELKIKSKSLAAEAQIIRKEERKVLEHSRACRKGNYTDPAPILSKYNDLRDHRIFDVRDAARSTHLARAMLAGRPYKTVEQPTRKPLLEHHTAAITRMVVKYATPYLSPTETTQAVRQWIEAA